MRQLTITKQLTPRTDESLGHYFREISKYALVTAEEEVELSIRIKKGDEEALSTLVAANLRFVISVAKQYQFKGLSLADLINEGNLGLVKAARKFDQTKGFKFISYAVWWIRQAILQAISEQTRMIRLPMNQVASIHKISKAIPYLEQEYEREPTEDEIAQHLQLSDDKIKKANYIKGPHISFDKPLVQDNAEHHGAGLYDLIQAGDTASPDDHLIRESLAINVQRALEKLSTREAEVLTMSFGLNGTPICSLQRIALKLEMSSERIRQIKRDSLSKLEKILKNNHFLRE
ncbi:MAG: RNA polymerase sigma factor RpoD/SigA [Bacteroidales bacterium]|nr:RNA polymerase sigma factor RpoD/SigA [Bacteroidales bacterium]